MKDLDISTLLRKAEEFEEIYRCAESTVKASRKSDSFEKGQLFSLETVFTHNDVLSYNIMVPCGFFDTEEINTITFIDYEYASYNCRAFDVANHFCGKNGGRYVTYVVLHMFASLRVLWVRVSV